MDYIIPIAAVYHTNTTKNNTTNEYFHLNEISPLVSCTRRWKIKINKTARRKRKLHELRSQSKYINGEKILIFFRSLYFFFLMQYCQKIVDLRFAMGNCYLSREVFLLRYKDKEKLRDNKLTRKLEDCEAV